MLLLQKEKEKNVLLLEKLPLVLQKSYPDQDKGYCLITYHMHLKGQLHHTGITFILEI